MKAQAEDVSLAVVMVAQMGSRRAAMLVALLALKWVALRVASTDVILADVMAATKVVE